MTGRHDPARLIAQALAHHRAGQLPEADRLYARILKHHPRHFDALHLRGVLRRQQGRCEEALTSILAALQVDPRAVEALASCGLVLDALGRHAEAVEYFDRALALKPDHAEALNNRGVALKALKRYDELLASYDRALAVHPEYVEALNNRGNVLLERERFAEALAAYDQALALRPGYVNALCNRGHALQRLARHADALASYDRALRLQPRLVIAFAGRGSALQALKRYPEALASYDQALALAPDHVPALVHRGIVLEDLQRHDEALASFDRALAVDPHAAEAHYNRGRVLQAFTRLDEAIESYERTLASAPGHPHATSAIANCALALCDWSRTEALREDLCASVAGQRALVDPLVLLGYVDDPALQLQCARAWSRDSAPALPPLWRGERWRNDRIRIAYLSADFRRHAVAYAIAEVLERHDRSRLEVLGISYGPDDASDMRARLVAAVDRFHDVRDISDAETATLMRDRNIDIAVDLTGYTQYHRPGILARRPAPIQASYLGYAGTMGAEFIDYVIADEVVLPRDQQPFYTERIVHLAGCYMPSDATRRISDTPTRRQAGLPEHGFVFCCFNNHFKITAPVFDVWMRLLARVDGSVLWLSHATGTLAANLRREAGARGIDPDRLVFAPRVERTGDHLARQRLADLFLDTLPYNAHATAGDALWAGLPVLTCRGIGFAARVAASQLAAAGLPDLVTQSLAEYEALALRLVTDSTALRGLRERLQRDGARSALFDSDRSRRSLEAVYARMWELWQQSG